MEKGRCRMCGACCTAIWLPMAMKDMKRNPSRNSDMHFVIRNMKQISRKKAEKLNSRLKKWGHGFFYVCNKYDRRNNRCTAYNNRPLMCKDYPWYYGVKSFENFYNDYCGFAIDSERQRLIELLKEIKHKRFQDQETLKDKCMRLSIGPAEKLVEMAK